MKTKTLVLSIVLPLLIIIAGMVIYVTSLFSVSGDVSVQISVDEGQVSINGDLLKSSIELDREDIVETGPGSRATLILYDSIIIVLEENTRIKIDDLTKEHPKIIQESGETWNQFTKISGVEAYSVSYGDNVASVRGTSFKLNKDKIVVGEGEVEYKVKDKVFKVTKGQVVENVNGEIIEREANSVEKTEIEKGYKESIDKLKELRQKEIDKNKKIVNLLKKQFDFTDEDIRETLDSADNGEIDLRELAEKSPIKTNSIEKIIRITEKIKELDSEI